MERGDNRRPARAGAAGVHVVVRADNAAAFGFYDRLGFSRLAVDHPGPVVYLGLTL